MANSKIKSITACNQLVIFSYDKTPLENAVNSILFNLQFKCKTRILSPTLLGFKCNQFYNTLKKKIVLPKHEVELGISCNFLVVLCLLFVKL